MKEINEGEMFIWINRKGKKFTTKLGRWGYLHCLKKYKE